MDVKELEKFFERVPVEKDTKILDRQVMEVAGLPVLIERWFWDGITASSAIVPINQLGDATEESFVTKLAALDLDMVGHTSKRKNGYLFINFAFTRD